jgi:CBS domain-containing protein
MALYDAIKTAVNWHAASVDAEDSLRTVIQKMVDSKVSALVVKSGDNVAGVVTDMDLMRCVVQKRDLDAEKAARFMTACELITAQGSKKTPCVQLDESESVENALMIMDTAGVHNLLVAGENQQAGMVSIRDLLRFVVS